MTHGGKADYYTLFGRKREKNTRANDSKAGT